MRRECLHYRGGCLFAICTHPLELFYSSEASLRDVKTFIVQCSTRNSIACSCVLFPTEQIHIAPGFWQCNLVAFEWRGIGEELSVKNFTGRNKSLVSVSPGRVAGEDWLFADRKATLTWLCFDNGDEFDVGD